MCRTNKRKTGRGPYACRPALPLAYSLARGSPASRPCICVYILNLFPGYSLCGRLFFACVTARSWKQLVRWVDEPRFVNEGEELQVLACHNDNQVNIDDIFMPQEMVQQFKAGTRKQHQSHKRQWAKLNREYETACIYIYLYIYKCILE